MHTNFKSHLMRNTALSAGIAGALFFGLPLNAAHAKSGKMKIEVGGYFTSLAGWATQNDSFESTANSTSRVSYDNFDIKNDSEIHFIGSTKLDNGITVEVVVEMETDQSNTGGADHVSTDDSFIALSGNFGKIAIGTQDHATVMIANTAPNVGAIPADDADDWIIKPSAIGVGDPFTHIGGATDMKITYLSPTFSGLTVAASYTPSDNAINTQPIVGGTAGTENQTYDAGIAYAGNLGAVSVGLDTSYWETHGPATSSLKGWRVGGVLEVSGFAVGAAYKDMTDIDSGQTGTANSNDEIVWEVGASYSKDAWAVGVTYVAAGRDLATATPGKDTGDRLTVGGSYTVGSGIDLLGTIARVDWDDESTADANNNDGWAVIGGISVAF